MLTQEDLKNIGVELGKVIEQNITPALEQMATKEDLQRIESRFDSIDSKLTAMQTELEDIRQKLNTVSLRTKDDDDSLVKDIFALQRRVDVLETQLKQMKLNQS